MYTILMSGCVAACLYALLEYFLLDFSSLASSKACGQPAGPRYFTLTRPSPKTAIYTPQCRGEAFFNEDWSAQSRWLDNKK
jgi:hypothetical protein